MESLATFMYKSNLFPGCGVVVPNTSLNTVTKLFESRARAVCIQGTKRDGFLDVF